MASQEELAEMEADRRRTTAAVVESEASKRLVVGGPGTGKSFTFKEALAEAIRAAGEGTGLALTFIRNLVADLQRDLGTLATVNTFHGYCKYLMHQHVGGLQSADLYPLLPELLVEDLAITGRRSTSTDEIEEHLHRLDTEDGLISDVMAAADYYKAVAFTDLVYRVLEHFRAHGEDVPEFPLVVVDEYQDFSLLETSFIDLLATKNRVLVAGDDDQALYSQLRYASPEYIRALAKGDEYELFELPYCSRCTEVVVAAVNDVIAAAVTIGGLPGRISKPFRCYLPDKQADSEANPRLILVDCSTANMPYAGQYIAQQIARIPAADIAVSREKGYPTALVIGPNPFLTRAYEVVRDRYPSARMKSRQTFAVDVLDGYERIAADERSRLGWRIVGHCVPPADWSTTLREALEGDADLVERLPEDYVETHSELAQLVGLLINDGFLPPADEERLCAAVDCPIDEVRARLALEPDDVEDEGEGEDTGEDAADEDVPDIFFTSLVGAKGLSAEHVFIVGLNNGHLPSSTTAIADDEICAFLVGLSRTRKRCHLISYRFAFSGGLQRSVFVDWVAQHGEVVTVNKDYDFEP
jgi:ATP-dependent DNA helicase UvrD/PcrA